MIKKLLAKYKEIITYVLFGVLSTIVNFGAFYIFNLILGSSFYLATNIIAWFFAVAFAYVTNKLWVFESKSWAAKVVVKEVLGFAAARLFSLGVEEVGLIIFVELLNFKSISFSVFGFDLTGTLIAKVILAVIVVILNYFFSKFVIFKKKNKYEIDSLIFSKGNNRDKTYVLSKAMLIVYIAFALIIIITFSFTILPVLKKKFWKLLKNKTLFHFLTVISAFALISCLLTISLFCVNELFIVIIIISVSILSIMLEVGMMISLNTLKNKTLSGTEIKWNSIDQNNIKDIEKYYNCCGYIKIYEKKDSNLCGSKFWNVSCFSKIQDSINSSILHVSFAGIFIMITNIISLFFKLYVSFND